MVRAADTNATARPDPVTSRVNNAADSNSKKRIVLTQPPIAQSRRNAGVASSARRPEPVCTSVMTAGLTSARHLFQQPAQSGQRIIQLHDTERTPQRRLIGGDHRLAQRALPCGDPRHGREIAARNDQHLDVGRIDAAQAFKRHVGIELANRVRIGRAEALHADHLKSILSFVIAFGVLDDLG